MFYAVGSLLFAFTLIAALSVIAVNLLHYRTKMVAALRMLSLDGLAPPAVKTPARIVSRSAPLPLAA